LSRGEVAALIALALGALWLRVWGLGQGYPEMYGHVDEVGVAASIWNFFRSATLLPTEFTYPAFYSYLVAAVLWLSAVLGWGPHLHNAFDSAVLISYLDPARAALVGRALSAVLSTVTVCLTFALARAAYGMTTAWIAALFMALAVVPVGQAHHALPDSTMACMAQLCFFFSWKIYREGKWRHYAVAGLAAGLVIASKYNGAFVALAIPTAHLLRSGWVGAFGGKLCFAVALAMGALFAGSPYLFLTPEKYWGLAQYQFSSLGFSLGDTQPWWWVFRALWQVEWLLGGLMLLGILHVLWRRDPLDKIFLAAWIPSFIYIGSWTRESLHYLLHFYPLWAIAAALLVQEGARRIVCRRRRRVVIWAVVVLVSLPSAVLVYRFNREMSQTDVRNEAAAWIEAHVDGGVVLGMTWLPYGPRLAWAEARRSIAASYRGSTVASQLLQEAWNRRPAYALVNLEIWLKHPVVPEVYQAHIDLRDPETRRVFSRGWRSPRQLRELGVQYLVLPEAAYGRFLHLPPPSGGLSAAHYHFVKNRAYFAYLTDPDCPETELVARFEPRDDQRGSAISVYRLLVD